jgi:ubiquinol-cytochrome c reductase cytochrome c subunit
MMTRTLAAALVVGAGIALGTVSGAAQTAGAATQSAPTPTGSIEKGRVTFVRTGCAQCHGREAQGSPTTGPGLGPGGLPYAAFARYVREPRQQMPPYTDRVLSEPDLADIYAFVQSRPKPVVPRLLQP